MGAGLRPEDQDHQDCLPLVFCRFAQDEDLTLTKAVMSSCSLFMTHPGC